MMTPVQILLVQTSFQMAGGDGTTLAAGLAQRLTARPRTEQVGQLAAALALAVRSLGRRRAPRSGLRRLRVHGALCRAVAQDAAFPIALLDSLEDALGATLPAPVREAWGAFHRLAASLLRDAAGKAMYRPT